jgi:hypothetical protein
MGTTTGARRVGYVKTEFQSSSVTIIHVVRSDDNGFRCDDNGFRCRYTAYPSAKGCYDFQQLGEFREK